MVVPGGPPSPAPGPPPERRAFKLADLSRPFARRTVDPRKRAALRADIARNGVLEPPHVAPDGTVLSGNERVGALIDLGAESVECLVFPVTGRLAQLAHARSMDVKSDVSRADQALRLATVRAADPALTQKQIAAALGESEATVSRLVDLLALPEDLLAAVLADRLKLQHVVAAARVKDPARKAALLRKCLADGTTPKELAASLKPGRRPAAKCHTLAVAGVTVAWPAGWAWARLDAALGEARAYLRERVRTTDVRALDLTALLDQGPAAAADRADAQPAG